MGAFFVSRSATITRHCWRVIYCLKSAKTDQNKRHKRANLTRFYVWWYIPITHNKKHVIARFTAF